MNAARLSLWPSQPAVFLPGFMFLLALGLRVAFIHHWGSTLTIQSDDIGYIESARRLAEDHVFSYWRPRLSPAPALGPTAYITPGYPVFLAVFDWLFGGGSRALAAARYAQAVVSSSGIFLVYRLGEHFGGRWAGFLASALCAFYPPFILFSGLLLTETVFTFLLLLFVYLWLKIRPFSARGYVLMGAVAGLATLVRPTGAALVVTAAGAAAWYGLSRDKNKRLGAAAAGFALVLAFCLTLSPWWVRNAVVFHRFIPLSEGGGNPLLLGTYVNLEGIKHGWHSSWPVGKDPMETSRLHALLAKKRIKEGFKREFPRYLNWYTRSKFKLLWGKVCLWGGEGKLPAGFTIYIHYFLLLAGSLGLTCSLVRRLPGAGRVLGILAVFTVVHLVTYAHCRYALPLLPLLAGFAFVPLSQLITLKGSIR